MRKSLYIKEITENIASFDLSKLKELSSYVKFLKYKEQIDPTLEILTNREFYSKVRQGIAEKENGELISWEAVK